MATLTIKEFLLLSHEEKCIRYKDLSDHDRWLWRTLYDIPVPITVPEDDENSENVKEFSEEEKLQYDKEIEKILKKSGAMKENDSIEEWRKKNK